MASLSPVAAHPAPSGGEVGPEVVGVLVEALAAMVYETTHLSPCKPNGDHDCTIKADTLDEARGALARGRALLPEPVDPDEQYARDLIREQGWEGEQQIGAEAVVRMIAAAHRSKGE